MDRITLEGLRPLFACVAETMDKNSDRLCAMDAEMGDGDLGLTMKRGFAAAPQAIDEAPEPDMGKKLMKAGMKISSVAPSTMGTLMASGLMSGGKKLSGKTEIGAEEYVAFLEGFCEGLIKRGKCAPGDRTVLDAMKPAQEHALAAYQNGGSLEETAAAALRGAEAGVESTKAMTAKFGKAAVFRDKTLGKADQGAVAGMLLVQAVAAYVCG